MESLGVSTTFSASNRSRQRERKSVARFGFHRGWKYERGSLLNATSVGEKRKRGKEGKNREVREREREGKEEHEEATLLQHDV